jgi:two-component system response regulator YesN
MKRILVVDDERPVVDHIVRTIEKELAGEFSVAGTASSGREALEKVPDVQPDIIVMDVRMPGLSGLDTIRELKRRGNHSAFLLSTAYERFDIAREALELGVADYMLKPVVKDLLIKALRNAADQFDRRSEFELKEFDTKEKDRQVKGFVTEAFLNGLLLGRSGDVRAMREWLGINKPWGLVAAASFLQHPQEGHEALESVLQYKSNALCGPLFSGRCLIFQPLVDDAEAPEAERMLLEAIGASLSDSLKRGTLQIGFADPRPIAELSHAWSEALGRLSSRKRAGPPSKLAMKGTVEEEFQVAMVKGDPVLIRFALETILDAFEETEEVAVSDRYRIISLLGTALIRLASLGHLDEAVVDHWIDFDDLRQARDGQELRLLARTRLTAITEAADRSRRRSFWVAAAMDFIAAHYSQSITLDEVAEHAGLSAKRLSRLFSDELGQGFSDYLIAFRIEKAKIFLTLPGASVKQVSNECGYPDPNYFARLFKKVTGLTPTEFSSAR